MNCSKCTLVITAKDHSLKCRGCSEHFHLTCLSSVNKQYKKSLITALINIPNLLWFCDVCLPKAIDTQPVAHNHTIQPNELLEQLVGENGRDSFQSQQANNAHNASIPLENVASTGTTVSENQDASIQMEIDHNAADLNGSVENQASKRRRLSTKGNDNAAEHPIPSISAVPRFSSTNYRCIYLKGFQPTMNEIDIIKYAVEKNRDATEIMECKKLLPAKCNMNRISFVSFKLTVHKEFYGVYIDPQFWPTTVKTEEFEVRPPKKRQSSPKFRVNPFAVPRPSQIQPVPNPPEGMTRTHSNGLNSNSAPNRHDLNRTHRNNNYRNTNVSSNARPNENHRSSFSNGNKNDRNAHLPSNARSNGNHRSSFSNRKNHQRRFTHQSPRRYQHQNTRQSNFLQNRGQRVMEPEQLMALFDQLTWQMKSLLNRR